MMPMVIQLQAPVRWISKNGDSPGAGESYEAGPDNIVLHPHMLRAEDNWLRSVVSKDRHLNLLVQCPDDLLATTIEEISELSWMTPWICTLPGELVLPDSSARPILLGDVSTLTLRQQIDLFDWLDRFGDAQVFSVTSMPLWPLVERGRYLEGLFYRLNVVTLTADCVRH